MPYQLLLILFLTQPYVFQKDMNVYFWMCIANFLENVFSLNIEITQVH